LKTWGISLRDSTLVVSDILKLQPKLSVSYRSEANGRDIQGYPTINKSACLHIARAANITNIRAVFCCSFIAKLLNMLTPILWRCVSPHHTDSQRCNSYLLPYYCVPRPGNSNKYDTVDSACVTCGPQILSELNPLAITIMSLGTRRCHSSHNLCLTLSWRSSQ
jgi:hypothetical protein